MNRMRTVGTAKRLDDDPVPHSWELDRARDPPSKYRCDRSTPGRFERIIAKPEHVVESTVLDRDSPDHQ